MYEERNVQYLSVVHSVEDMQLTLQTPLLFKNVVSTPQKSPSLQYRDKLFKETITCIHFLRIFMVYVEGVFFF
jgi:hypothetical protein